MMYYFIGIREPGMLSLALFMKELGYEISCNEKEKIEGADNLFSKTTIDENMKIIKGEFVDDDNEEIKEAKNKNLRTYTYSELINILIEKHKTIIVIESNKYLLSSTLSSVLNEISTCNCLIAGRKVIAVKRQEYLVLSINFLQFKEKMNNAKYSILSNKFEPLDSQVEDYHDFLNKTDKIILAYGDKKNSKEIDLIKPIFLYGLEKDNDITIQNLEKSTLGYVFDVTIEDNYYGHFDLPLSKKEDIVDVLATITICYYERFAAKDVSKALKKVLKKT